MLFAYDVLPLAVLPQPLWWLAGIVMLALAVDRFWGEPPVRLHPVVWMGNYLQWAGEQVQRRTVQQVGTRDLRAFGCGMLFWWMGAVAVAAVACALQHMLLTWQNPVESTGGSRFASTLLCIVAMALLLKPLLAWAMLRGEVLAVEAALSEQQGGGLEAGRARLRWLVSRDVSALSASGVRESAIESLAENLNDSVIAPLFWFVLLGLPGAAVYRFANTADAMWGYKGVYQGHNWEWAGKWAARADDVLSWVPARMTAVLLLVAAGQGWKPLPTEAARTPSPNSGWPMAAMALALDVRLAKPGVYVLNPTGAAPADRSTAQAVAYGGRAVLLFAGLIAATAALCALAGAAV